MTKRGRSNGMKRAALWLSGLFLVCTLAACGGGTEHAQEETNPDQSTPIAENREPEKKEPEVKEEKPEPITLQISDQLFSEDEFNKFISEPVVRKFPHLTIERIIPNNTDRAANLEQYATWAATNNVPDILMRYGQGTADLNQLDIPANLTEHVKRTGMDLSVYEDSLLETAYKFSTPGMTDVPDQYLAGLPLYQNFRVLLYNKDIFDNFGVPYPEEGLTYDDIIALSKELTRVDESVQYKGYNVTWNMFNDQLSLPLVDPQTNTALVDQLPGYKQIFDFGKTFYSIEGTKNESDREMFLRQRTQAMSSYWISDVVKHLAPPEMQSLNWDITLNPVFEPGGANSGLDFHAIYVSKVGDHQEAAFEVVRYLSTSKEAQSLFARNGYVPNLKDASIVSEWGVDVPHLQGKNLSVVAKTKTAPRFEVTRFDSEVNKYVFEAFGKMVNEGVDANTALREAAEKMNQHIKTMLAQ